MASGDSGWSCQASGGHDICIARRSKALHTHGKVEVGGSKVRQLVTESNEDLRCLIL